MMNEYDVAKESKLIVLTSVAVLEFGPENQYKNVKCLHRSKEKM